jgi:CDP-diacylglycerol--glycerol-3-phosphate 3-phosphatidyltransferase
MLDHLTRARFAPWLDKPARGLLRLGLSPDAVTVIGTAGVCAGALVFFPMGELTWGVVVITLFVFSDNIDGAMARLSGRTGKWGSFLDSTLDRLGDGAIFGGLALYFASRDELEMVAVTLACLVLGGLVSYARARAEGLGMTANVGVAERADRLVSTLVAAFLAGLGVPYVLEVVLWALAVLSLVTVLQRMVVVYRQAEHPAPIDLAAAAESPTPTVLPLADEWTDGPVSPSGLGPPSDSLPPTERR